MIRQDLAWMETEEALHYIAEAALTLRRGAIFPSG